ncbi:hypothetical protein MLD38_005086 [Melastoma candidum]|uniref:Uncharacterized protein n=1 Tax=Melastoma candidum TaxID=119954 RepID=A0ACB9S6Z7_9MYRT|nr:hypothetical protein MLD38_005086 [Melastoma candidum]
MKKDVARKCEDIAIDFVTNLPRGGRNMDSVWVVVDRLTTSAHSIHIQINWSLESLAKLYIKEIVIYHGVPHTITSNRDPRFTSKLWKNLQEALDTKLQMSTAFHPQTD